MRGRDWFKHHAATAEDVASAAPWRSVPVPDVEPFVVNLEGTAVRLVASELAAHAGLELMDRAPSLARPGQLCGAVLLPDVQGSALVAGGGCDFSRLMAHQLTTLNFTQGAVVDLQTSGRRGRVLLWPCVAEQPRAPAQVLIQA